MTDFTSHYISDLKRGKYEDNLDILANVLGVSVYQFFIENQAAKELPERLDIYRKSKKCK